MGRIWLGVSGFSYKEWKPSFYPAGLPDKRMLEFYSTRLNSVEIDSTFYRMPVAKTIEGWRDSTPEDFRFVIKSPQLITHRKRLAVPSEALDHLAGVVRLLGHRLGLVTFQLPPFFKADPGRLEAFLAAIPPDIPTAFEFRHDSWFSDAVYGLLEQRQAVLCIHDADEGAAPMRLTAKAAYVRLRRSGYSPELRREWQERMRRWAADGVEVFAYIKHKDNPDAALRAVEFAHGLGI